MRIAVLTDVHGNLPALQAALSALEHERYDALVHLGDAIAIGPCPSECLDLLLNVRDARFIMGNHDEYFSRGIPASMAAGSEEYEHQCWVHRQIDSNLRPVVAQWPYHFRLDLEGVEVGFLHYPLDQQGLTFAPIAKDVTASVLDKLFLPHQSDRTSIHCYGHDHRFSDIAGISRYVNPGSLGCCDRPVARYTIIQTRQGMCEINHRAVDYDDRELFQAFETRQVPARSFIYRAFFGGRFGG
jgi:predicted phosphodiesterase